MKDTSDMEHHKQPKESSEERRCKARGRAALKAFNHGKASFRVEPRFGAYYQFAPETLDGHLQDIQRRLGAAGYQTKLSVSLIESGSDKQIPAYDLNLIAKTTDTETR